MPAESQPLLRGLHQLAFAVRDLPSAVAFWRDVLGLRLLFEAPPGLAFFDVGSVRVMLTRPEGSAGPPSNSPLYFAVDDIRAAHAVLERRGVVFEEAPRCIATLPEAGGRKREAWLAAFRDGERNLLALMSEVMV